MISVLNLYFINDLSTIGILLFYLFSIILSFICFLFWPPATACIRIKCYFGFIWLNIVLWEIIKARSNLICSSPAIPLWHNITKEPITVFIYFFNVILSIITFDCIYRSVTISILLSFCYFFIHVQFYFVSYN